MTKPSLGIGIVGAGFIGPAHIEALRRIDFHVVGLVASTPEDASEKARRLNVEKSYRSLEEMIADPEIDVVHLTTPNYLHYPQAKMVLEAGKHVVCEKPLATESWQAADLIRLAREKNRVGVVNFNLRYYPLVFQARQMVQEGMLGDVFIIHGSYLQDWLLLPTDWNWRLEPERGGPLRAVADIGSHWLDMVTFVSGLKVEAVMADFKTFLPYRKKPARSIQTFTGSGAAEGVETIDQPITSEDYASILIHFENDVRGAVTISQVSAGRKNRLFFEVDGSLAAAAWNSERPNELWIGHRKSPNELLMKDPFLLLSEARQISSYPGGHNEGFPDTFKQLYLQVYAYIQAGDFTAPAGFPTFEDGYYELVLAEAIERSAKNGVWTEVSAEPA